MEKPLIKEIVIKCEGAALYEWKKLKNFQGDLKDLTEDGFNKLRAQIVENGFKAPFFVWKGHDFILDGHQRIRVLGELEKDGYKIPAKLPVVYIIAETEKQAKKDVLGFISEYGQTTDEGLYQFLHESNLIDNFADLKDTIDLPGVNIEKFSDGYVRDFETDKTGFEDQYGVDGLDNIYSFNDFVIFKTDSKYGIPEIRADRLSKEMPSRCYVRRIDGDEAQKNSILFDRVDAWPKNAQDCILGYYTDDDRFEQVWTNSVKYLEKVKKHNIKNMITPNFSAFDDFPFAVKIWQLYRSRWVARYWQEAGINIIPDIWMTSLEEKQSIVYEGLPEKIPVAAVQIRTNTKSKDILKSYIQRLKTYLENVNVECLVIYTSNKNYDLIKNVVPKIHKGNIKYVTSFMDRSKGNVTNRDEPK